MFNHKKNKNKSNKNKLNKISKTSQNFFRLLCKISFIKFDFSFIFILVLSYFTGQIRIYFVYIFFLILHELCHYAVAKKLGYLAKNIKLNFFGASLEGLDDFLIEDEIKIIFAGPLFNFAVIIFCYISFWFYPESYNFLYEILVVNMSILLFNFLPIFPLDFGRIILAHFSKKYMREKALFITKNISFIFVFILFFLSVISIFWSFNFMLGLISVNLYKMLILSSDSSSYKRGLFIFYKKKLISKGLLERNICISNKIEKYKLFKFIDQYHFVNFILLNDNYEVTEKLSEIDLYKMLGFY